MARANPFLRRYAVLALASLGIIEIFIMPFDYDRERGSCQGSIHTGIV
jgi:hypothetical protein